MGIQKNFVVKNGLEVNTNLIVADAEVNRVGIAITAPVYTLHVYGGIGATTANITENTIVNNIEIDGRITAGSSLGAAGQYLVSTGAGVSWTNPPALRTTTSVTADIGDVTFNVSYRVGLLDVFVNGVRLTEDEFTANDSATVTLLDPCFGGETVEFVSYSPSALIAGTGIEGLTILEEGSPVGSPSQVSSINFVGSAVTAVGSGLGVTVYISGSTGGSSVNYWQSTSSGINTISNVGLGTTNPRFFLEVGPVGYSGTSLLVNGNARVTGILTIGTSSITLNGATNVVNVGSGITISGDTSTINVGSGITISGDTSTINVGSGVTIVGNTSTINVGSGITISGNTSTINVGSGVTIVGDTGTIKVSSLEIKGEVLSGAGVTSVTAGSGIAVSKNGGNVQISTTDEWTSSLTNDSTNTNLNVGIGTDYPQAKLDVRGNVSVSGIITATGGFISVGNTTPILISLSANKLTFTAVGIGSTTFTLF
jgi:hypothetical protein